MRESNGDLDGVIDLIVKSTYARDARGNVTLAVTEFDFGARAR